MSDRTAVKEKVRPTVDLAINARVAEEVLAGFIADETKRTGRGKVVLGLSGGVDSAVSAALAARALGGGNVLAVLMPHRVSAPSSLKDALALVKKLRLKHEVVEISPMVDPFFERFPDAGRVRRGNTMARQRMSIIYDRSAEHDALVVGTSNKTELLLGYGTLFGDMASAINPIGDLYKTQVWQLAEHLRIPEAIRKKAPSADLWVGQTDEGEMGVTYGTADAILHLLYDERCTADEVVAAGFKRAVVDRLRRKVETSQFKRRLPLIAKISSRTIGVDFRYPRDWGT